MEKHNFRQEALENYIKICIVNKHMGESHLL